MGDGEAYMKVKTWATMEFMLLTKIYSHNLKAESYFIWWECLGLRAWETASQ